MSPTTPALLFGALCVFSFLPRVCDGQTEKQSTDATALVRQGESDLDRSSFSAAQVSLLKAIALDPNDATSHLLLAQAYLGQLPPPKLFPDSQGVLPKAKAEALRALELSPNDSLALLVFGKIENSMAVRESDSIKKAGCLNAARRSFLKALDLNPKLLEAHDELAEMALTETMMPILIARASAGVPLGQKGWIQDAGARRQLRERYGPAIEDGIAHLDKALAIDPTYEKGMRTMSALLLLRANMRENEAEYRADSNSSAEWQRKADVIRKQVVVPENGTYPGGVLGGIIGSLPPPPPK